MRTVLYQSTPGITPAQAVEQALRFANGTQWQLAFLSNTGVSCSVLSEQLDSMDEAFMLLDGTAGQWVVEFVQQPRTPALKTPNRPWYRIRSVIITARGATVLPDTTCEQSGPLVPLQLDWVHGLEAARRRVLSKVHCWFDCMSVTSEIDATGGGAWLFLFFQWRRGDGSGVRKVVARATVAADGRDAVVW